MQTDQARGFAARLRQRAPSLGYWTQLPVPALQERLARQGYDYICFDAQHGFLDYASILNGLIAVSAGAALAGNGCAGLVRVAGNSADVIGQALDAGARGVIVPLIETAEDAARAVSHCRYPPQGLRSYGPMRAGLRSGPLAADMNDEVACIVMIETAEALARVAEIAAVPGIDGLYIGPADLMLALGGASANDPARAAVFEAALAQIRMACAAAGIAAGIHVMDGETARRRLDEGFTFATISGDLNHLDRVAAQHLALARPPLPKD